MSTEERLYDALGAQLEAESRRLYPAAFEGRSLVPVAEAAKLMGRPEAEVRMLAESRLLHAERRGDEFLVRAHHPELLVMG